MTATYGFTSRGIAFTLVTGDGCIAAQIHAARGLEQNGLYQLAVPVALLPPPLRLAHAVGGGKQETPGDRHRAFVY